MLRLGNELQGYSIRARDGEIGKAHDFLFDDHVWAVRYLVVNTGSWLSGRLVLINPEALEQPEWHERVFPVALRQHQVESSPEVDLAQPVSRQKELELRRHYGWAAYWPAGIGVSYAGAPAAVPAAAEAGEHQQEEHAGDPNLRSMREVSGYRIRARNGEIGHVDDFVVDDGDWVVRYAVVDTRNWLPGKKVLVAPAWIQEVQWEDAQVCVDLTREQIAASPGFDPNAPVNREYERRLYDYYGRPKYWV